MLAGFPVVRDREVVLGSQNFVGCLSGSQAREESVVEIFPVFPPNVRGFHLTQPRISIGLKRSVIWLELHLRGVGGLAGDALRWFWGSRGATVMVSLPI